MQKMGAASPVSVKNTARRPVSTMMFLFVMLSVTNMMGSEALKLRHPTVRRGSFLRRGFRRFDAQEELDRKRTGVVDIAQLPELRTEKIPSLNLPSLQETSKRAPSKSITNVHELRTKVLDEGVPLGKVQIELEEANLRLHEVWNHEVIQIIVRRFKEKSMPGNRPGYDKDRLALSIEGGGMRGAVSAGMAAAIACLGLTDTFDAIYGSSAGSVIGAYMVSRQMCMDVYVDILPAAQRTFVCIKRMFSALAITGVDWVLSHFHNELPKLATTTNPGMNISFVLDGIMDDQHGIRPLDIDCFLENDQKQPLRIASSYVKDGKLYTKCFGTEDFSTVRREDGQREGVYACLEASMTVPGATGPPVRINNGNETLPFFDAFCFEPLPYRSAVEEGATHVLVLCSRPEGYQPPTKPGIYERAIAPLYFRSHGEPKVAEYFQQGGQQFIYAEDLLTLEEGRRAGEEGITVPPPRILYGVEKDDETISASRRETWKKAHLFPLKVPLGTRELPTLEQGREEVLEAVRGGFAAAFDLLAPAIGLDLNPSMTGKVVAMQVFPNECLYDEFLLENQLRIFGDSIVSPTSLHGPPGRRRKRDVVLQLLRSTLRLGRRRRGNSPTRGGIGRRLSFLTTRRVGSDQDEYAERLLALLPGLQSGKFSHLSTALRNAGGRN